MAVSYKMPKHLTIASWEAISGTSVTPLIINAYVKQIFDSPLISNSV